MRLPDNRARRALLSAKDAGYGGALEGRLGVGRKTISQLLELGWIEESRDALDRSRYAITEEGTAVLETATEQLVQSTRLPLK